MRGLVLVMGEIWSAIRDLGPDPMTRDVARIEGRLYRMMPGDESGFLAACDQLVASGGWPGFWLATRFVRRRRVYRVEHLPVYERWLSEFATGWGRCDVLCYRVLNPMVERFPELFDDLLRWARSPRTYVRRAAAVALIRSSGTFVVSASFGRVRAICEILKGDAEPHVQKGIGWLLKYAYLSNPGKTVAYLREHVGELSRTTFRYALEKMPDDLKRELMAIRP